MIDREKVIKGLNDIGGFIAGRLGFEQARNFLRTIDDAIGLLKEQEAVEPSTDIVRNRRCPKCFTIIKGKFCHECGQAVKWE